MSVDDNDPKQSVDLPGLMREVTATRGRGSRRQTSDFAEGEQDEGGATHPEHERTEGMWSG